MKFYYFGGNLSSNNNQMEELEEAGFEGVLFTYNPNQGDFFTLVARDIDKSKKIKYMIAIRPHTLSPQYLCMINHSISTIMKNRLQINLIAGHIKEDEKNFGGILGDVTDLSSVPDRVNNTIAYLDELKKMESNPKVHIPDFYVSCTNPYLFNAAAKHDYKIILPYRDYNNGFFLDTNEYGNTRPGQEFSIEGKKIMLALGPIIRDSMEEIDELYPKTQHKYTFDGRAYMDRPRFATDTEYFTYDQFVDFVHKLESQNINEVMLHGWPFIERPIMIDYIKRYTSSK